MERKSFLKNLAVAAISGPMVLSACKKDSADATVSSTTAKTSTTTTTASGCITTPTEEEGPFPYPVAR